jgi:hypothetical protein
MKINIEIDSKELTEKEAKSIIVWLESISDVRKPYEKRDPEPEARETPEPEKPAKKAKKVKKSEPKETEQEGVAAKPPEKASSTEKKASSDSADEAPGLDRVQVRKLFQQKLQDADDDGATREKCVKKLSELGASVLPDLAPEDYQEFVDFLETL